MKIYTITFSNTCNVGAMLQEYSLYRYLKDAGHDVMVVDYLPPLIEQNQSTKINIEKGFFALARQLILMPLHLAQSSEFQRFNRTHVSLTPRCHSAEEICTLPPADAYIVGSDQIWNPDFVGVDDGFFLCGVFPGKKISYAGSAGGNHFSDEIAAKMAVRLKQFDCVSVRESDLKQCLEKNGVSPVDHVLDPVFLLERQDYLKIEKPTHYKNYLFLYVTERDPRLLQFARKVAQTKNLKIIQMNRLHRQEGVDKCFAYVTPQEFLGLVNGASYIVTNSFHCLAFSIIFQKQFLVVSLKHLNSRLASLLQLLGVEKNMITSDIVSDLPGEINYESVSLLLANYVKKSKEFLNKSLQ